MTDLFHQSCVASSLKYTKYSCALAPCLGGKSRAIGSCRWVLAFHYVGVFEPVPSSFGATQTLAENLAPSALADGFSPFIILSRRHLRSELRKHWRKISRHRLLPTGSRLSFLSRRHLRSELHSGRERWGGARTLQFGMQIPLHENMPFRAGKPRKTEQ